MIIGLVIFGFGIGFLRFSGLSFSEKDTPLDYFVDSNQKVQLRGYIADRPDIRDDRIDILLKTDSLIVDFQHEIPIHTQILLKIDSYDTYFYGEEILVTGHVQIPDSFKTDQGRIFEYDKYLYKDDIFYTMSYVHIIKTGETISVSWFRQTLYRLKDYFISSIRRYIPRPESGLLAGVLFGEKSALDAETLEQFRIVGLMHIVVLSGYNVAIVIYSLMYLLRRVPLLIRSVLAVCGILAFMILTGAGPTVVRASVMGLLIILSKLMGEKYDVHKSLLIAGFVMIMINPKILYFDISFQLSFLATYGLIIFSPWLEKKFKKVPSSLMLRESLVATIAAQITVLPLILYRIGEFSIISIVVNMLVLFAVPASMLFGFMVAIFGWLGDFALLFSIPATFLLKYILFIVDIFSQFSFSIISIPKFHWLLMIILYGIIFVFGYRLLRKQKL